MPPRVLLPSDACRTATFVFALLLGACDSSPVGPDVGLVMNHVHASEDFTCALEEGGRALCWGLNDLGQLGPGTALFESSPQVVSEELRFLQLSTKPASRHVCGITTSGDSYCWGNNNFGQIGTDSDIVEAGPQLVSGGLSFQSITAGWRSTCAVTTDGDAYCWGRGEWGQLGDGLAKRSSVPTAVAGGHKFQKVDVGSNNLVCGLTSAGRILCWGLDLAGALGSPSSETCVRTDGLELACATTPQPITSDEFFVDVSAGSSFACGITGSLQVLCWGRNDQGQLGRATTEICSQGPISGIPCGSAPMPVSEPARFVTVTTGSAHACGVTRTGGAYCWGRNSFGELGSGVVATTGNVPARVRGPVSFRTVSAGNQHSCGEGTDGELYCWGSNVWGQLGTGDRRLWLEPARVASVP